MICIDGSYGEGGGQVLRTSLSLAAITGQAIRIEHIRAGRKKPGLAAQHLTAVRAVAAICDAEVRGDDLGSTFLEFIPRSTVKSGSRYSAFARQSLLELRQYHFEVTAAQTGGSAGAVTLILQTILLPLALATDDSEVTLRGGTHVPFSPPLTYIEQVYLPVLRQMGVQARVKLNAWGWYPQGGGEVELQVRGSSISGIDLCDRGTLQQVRGLAVVTELPAHIPQRMASRAENLLRQAHLKVSVQPLRDRGIAPGAGIFLTAEYANTRAGFGALGRVGLPANKVAEIACTEFLNFHETGAPVDVYLADQLLLPAALAAQPSQYRVAEISSHLTTNAWVIEQFGVARVSVDATEKLVAIAPLP